MFGTEDNAKKENYTGGNGECGKISKIQPDTETHHLQLRRLRKSHRSSPCWASLRSLALKRRTVAALLLGAARVSKRRLKSLESTVGGCHAAVLGFLEERQGAQV